MRPEQLGGKRCMILYGSETGTAEEVAFKIYRMTCEHQFNCAISSLDDYDITSLPTETCIVWVVSTTGEGEVPSNMKRFWNFLLRKSLSPDSLSGVFTAVFGLGDSSYEKFNSSARCVTINNRVYSMF
jgi:sulfite reductase alpha subunit-like flavoprotein